MKKITILLSLLLLLLLNQRIIGLNDINNFRSKIEQGKVILPHQNLESASLTEVLTKKWITGIWEDVGRVIYTYNSDLLTAVYFDSLHEGNWKTLIENTNEYDSGRLLKSIITIKDINGNVEVSTMIEYSYYGDKISEEIRSSWDETSQSYVLSGKSVYEYSGELISKTTDYQWDETAGNWLVFMETEFSYDTENREIELVSKIWDESAGQFINSDRTTTEYYDGLKISTQENRSWDPVNEVWSEDNYYLYEYQYDGNGNKTEYVFTSAFGFGGFSILIKSKSTYEYDANNHLILEKTFNWDDLSSSWVESGKVEYSNDAAGLVQYDIHYTYDGVNYLNHTKNIYSYEDVVDIENSNIVPDALVLYQNYPNPFNPSTVISFSVPGSENITLQVFDILGNHISTLIDERLSSGDHRVTFDVSELSRISSGVYIISLTGSKYSLTKKCLLLK